MDYFEFLLTLIPFRTDAKDGDIARLTLLRLLLYCIQLIHYHKSIRRLYFEVFDVDGNHTISQDELQWILSKLLGEAEGGVVMHPAAMIYQQVR